MKSLAQQWPENMNLHLYVGSEDTLVRPEASSTKALYDAVEANAKTVTVIEGLGHVDYNSIGPEIMNASRGEPVQGFQSVRFNDRDENAKAGPSTTVEVAQATPTPQSFQTAMER
jgi:hypothetical protein